jgi:hypothetical protein
MFTILNIKYVKYFLILIWYEYNHLKVYLLLLTRY